MHTNHFTEKFSSFACFISFLRTLNSAKAQWMLAHRQSQLAHRRFDAVPSIGKWFVFRQLISVQHITPTTKGNKNSSGAHNVTINISRITLVAHRSCIINQMGRFHTMSIGILYPFAGDPCDNEIAYDLIAVCIEKNERNNNDRDSIYSAHMENLIGRKLLPSMTEIIKIFHDKRKIA